MNIYEIIKEEHDRHRGMAAGLTETHGDSAERRRLFNALRADVEAHAAAEEMTLYKAMLDHQNTQEQAQHSIAEHHEFVELFEELEDTDMSSSAWLTKARELRHELEHHMDEEEEDVFPLARKHIGAEEAEKLAAEFNRLKDEQMDKRAA